MRCRRLQNVWLGSVALVLPLVVSPALGADRRLAAEAVPVVGKPFDAQLTGIDLGWNLTLDGPEGSQILAAQRLVRWGAFRENNIAPRAILRDGSVLVADLVEIDDASITIESAIWPRTKIALASLAGFVFAPPGQPLARDRLLRRIRSPGQTKNLVLLRNGDEIAGRLTAAADGGPADDETGVLALGLKRRADGEPTPVEADNMVAALFQAAEVEVGRLPPTGCWLGFGDGSLLAVDAVDAGSRDVVLTMSGGVTLTVTAEELWPELRFVQPLLSKVRYVSDLSPQGYQHSPFLELKRNLSRDRNVLGGRLRGAGVIHLKGLGMPTTSRVVYELTAEDRRFAADLALDDASGDQGSAVYRVFLEHLDGDQQSQWRAAHTSQVVHGGDPPRSLSIELEGATRIALIVDFADRGDQRDYANWLNARFLP